MARSFTHFFSRCFSEHPRKSQSMAAASLWTLADIISQKIEHAKQIDWTRTARMALFGFAVAGPVYSWWYRLLDKRTSHLALKMSRTRLIATKLFFDQCVFEPPALAFFFVVTSLMEKPEIQPVVEKLKAEYLSTYAADCTLWPGVQAVNFTFIHPIYHALVVNTVSVVWVTYLSYVRHRALPDHHNNKAFATEFVAKVDKQHV